MAYSPTIARRFITHLFWGRFAYKVETVYPARGFRPSTRKPNPWNTPFEVACNDRKRYKLSISTFRRACLKAVPRAKDTWKLYETERSLHFFFEHKEDFDRFVASNKRRICITHEPASDIEIGLLRSSKNVYLRKTLFHGAYRFCVKFRRMMKPIADELEQWLTDIFGDNPDRFYYSHFVPRRLYLSAENDILLVRLAFSQHVLSVQKVILRSEIPDDHAIGKEAPGERSNSV